jgi:hypothetical protein
VERPVYMYVRDTLVLIVERHICMYVSFEIPLPSDGFFSTCFSHGTSESSTYGKQQICRCNSASTHFHVSWLSDFIFYPKPLYKSLHQSFFYSFITILHSITARFCLRSSFRHVDSFSNLQT